MIFDREDQRKLFLDLIDNSNFTGKTIDQVYMIKQEIKQGSIVIKSKEKGNGEDKEVKKELKKETKSHKQT